MRHAALNEATLVEGVREVVEEAEPLRKGRRFPGSSHATPI